MGSNYLIKCLFVFLILWVKFNLLHSYEAKVIGGLCISCVKGLVRWNSSFLIWGSWLLRAAPVPRPAALICAFAMLGWEWQLQSLQVVYKAWSWFWCPMSTVYNFSSPSLTEYLSRGRSASYCIRDLKNSEGGHFSDCITGDATGVVTAWNIPDLQASDIRAESSTFTHNGREKRHLNRKSLWYF